MAEQVNTEQDRPNKGEREPKATRSTRARTNKSEDTPRRRTPADRKIMESVSAMYTMAGGLINTAGTAKQDPGLLGTGAALMDKSDLLAEAWMDLADANPKVKAALRKFTEGGQAATLIALHGACLFPLLASRGIIPVGRFGAESEPTATTNGATP